MKMEVDLSDDTITVNGVKVRFSFLLKLCDPNPNKLLRFYLGEDNDVRFESYDMKDVEALVK